MNYILDRLKEDSSWRGLVLILTAVGVHLDEAQASSIVAAGLAIVGLINVFRRQK